MVRTAREVRSLWTSALIAKSDLDGARAVATEGLQKFAADAISLVTMARVHLASAEFNEAGQSLYQAVKQDPRLAVAHLELGRLYQAERRMASAKKHYRAAFDLAPDHPDALLAWSRTVIDSAEQLALLEKYLALTTGSSDERRSVTNLVELMRKVGDNANCRLRGEPKETALKIQEIRAEPGAANRYALKLSINGGSEIRTLVDTGATGIVITESLARSAKLERLGSNLLLGLGKEGVREGYFARAQTLAAQGLVYDDCVVEVVPDEVMENHTTQALMGLDGLYRDFVIRFDFGGAELGLSPLPPLPGSEQGRPDCYSYDRNVNTLPPGFYPARVFGKDFVVPVILNDQMQTYFLIDSGAWATLMSKRTAEQLGGIRPSKTTVYGLSGQVEQVWTAPPVVMNVLGVGQKHEDMLAIDLDLHPARTGIGIDGLLGYSFLQHSVLTLDDRNGLVHLELGRVIRKPAKHRADHP